MRKILPIIGILVIVAVIPSIIGALIGTKGTGTFAIDFLLFVPIIPVIALSIILWLLGEHPLDFSRQAKETAPVEPELEEEPTEESTEPEAKEGTATEIEEDIDEEIEKETSETIESLCPTCGATCPLEDTYCPHCGAEFEDEVGEDKTD